MFSLEMKNFLKVHKMMPIFVCRTNRDVDSLELYLQACTSAVRCNLLP